MGSEWWAADLAGGVAAGGFVGLDDNVLTGPAGDGAGGAVQVGRADVVAQPDPVADLDPCGCLVGLGAVAVLMAFTDGSPDRGQVPIEATGVDQTDQHQDLPGANTGRTGGVGLGAGTGRAGGQSRRGGADTRSGAWPPGSAALTHRLSVIVSVSSSQSVCPMLWRWVRRRDYGTEAAGIRPLPV